MEKIVGVCYNWLKSIVRNFRFSQLLLDMFLDIGNNWVFSVEFGVGIVGSSFFFKLNIFI